MLLVAFAYQEPWRHGRSSIQSGKSGPLGWGLWLPALQCIYNWWAVTLSLATAAAGRASPQDLEVSKGHLGQRSAEASAVAPGL